MTTPCPHCLGLGWLYVFVIDEKGPRKTWDRCEECKGTGEAHHG